MEARATISQVAEMSRAEPVRQVRATCGNSESVDSAEAVTPSAVMMKVSVSIVFPRPAPTHCAFFTREDCGPVMAGRPSRSNLSTSISPQRCTAKGVRSQLRHEGRYLGAQA
jgi:hypothetical protein